MRNSLRISSIKVDQLTKESIRLNANTARISRILTVFNNPFFFKCIFYQQISIYSVDNYSQNGKFVYSFCELAALLQSKVWANICTNFVIPLTLSGNHTERAKKLLLELEPADLAIVLSSDWFCESSEVEIFRLVLKWHETYNSNNDTLNIRLINSIRWSLLEDSSELSESEKMTSIFKLVKKIYEERRSPDNSYNMRANARKKCVSDIYPKEWFAQHQCQKRNITVNRI